MRYLDTGSRDPSETLGSWFNSVLAEDISHLRLQTGFYSLDGLAPLLGVLSQLSQQGLPIKALVGSNDGGTLRNDVEELAHRMGVPREHAQLGVVAFRGSTYYHPKVYHFERSDGSQVAFVGSANLTNRGIERHIEAGIALDSRQDGDAELTRIAAAVDRWFSTQTSGLTVIDQLGVLDQLAASGILALVPPPRTSSGGSTSSTVDPRPPLGGLMNFPKVKRLVTQAPPPAAAAAPAAAPAPASPPASPPASASAPAAAAAPTPVTPPALPAGTPATPPSVTTRPVTGRQGFPPYLLFEPNATTHTRGISALSGSALPNNAAGLVVKLNRDSARHFSGGTGTSNISLPVATVLTLRFGVAGVHQGPTAKFDLKMRYIGNAVAHRMADTSTSVKGYGYTAKETGHGDIRMVVTAEARRLKDRIVAAQNALPRLDDVALLEWPTDADPTFKLTFLEPLSTIHQVAHNLYVAAENSGQVVGAGACWLPAGVAPTW